MTDPRPAVSGRKNVGVLVSGRGTNLSALIANSRSGSLRFANLAVVISNNPASPALDYARAVNIPAFALDHRKFPGDRAAHEAAMVRVLRQHQVEWVIMAGYMRLLTSTFIDAYRGRILNIHPSLLPAFPGVNAPQQAVDYGAKISGCTVHFVEEQMDSGPIVYQTPVTVLPEDTGHTLAARILEQEHRALSFVVDLATSDRIKVDGRTVYIMPGESAFHEMERGVRSYRPVVVATGNQHKIREIRSILSEMRLSFLSTQPFQPAPEVDETGATFRDNARIKAEAWRDRTGMWSLADDSGLVIDALGGAPGLFSARYAPTNEERIARVLQEMQGVAEENRTARFICSCALAGPKGELYEAEGICEGTIAAVPSGEGGFGYDPIFLPEGFRGHSMAEMSDITKNNVSHRARALYGLKPALERLAKN